MPSACSIRPEPRVSIVLPARNAAATLPAALASLQAQSEPNWELLAVDDGSTDGTSAVLREFAAQDSRARVWTTPPLGIVAALNLGLTHARSPLVARMDADDQAHPRRLERQCAYLDAHPEVGLVSCLVDFTSANADRPAGGYRRHVDWLNTLISPEAIRRARFIEAPLAHPSVVFRGTLVGQFGGYRDGEFPEDYDLWLRWLEADVRMAKVPEKLLHWTDRPGRLSRISARYSAEAFYRLKAPYLARWLAQTLPAPRPVWIWGAGRLTRTRVAWLFEAGVKPAGWIDIDRRKIGRRYAGQAVCPPEGLLTPPRPFVLVYVAKWDARELIASWLGEHGFTEEQDYLFCA